MGSSRNVAARTRGRDATGLRRPRRHRVLLAVAATLAFVSSIGVGPNRAASQMPWAAQAPRGFGSPLAPPFTGLEATQVAPGPVGPRISLATYLGSELADGIVAVETDLSGNVFVFGTVPDAAVSIPFVVTPFFDAQPLANATGDCYLAKFVPDITLDVLEPAYFAIVHDSRRCDAMAVAPFGDVYIARTNGDSAVAIERFSHVSPQLTRASSFLLPQLATVTHLRVDDQGNAYAVGECANESSPGDLWPLPNGYDIRPAGVSPPCVDTTAAGQPGGQYLMVKAGPQGNLLYGSFFGFASSQIDPTSVELDNVGRLYIAGHTNVGGPTILRTFNAFLLQPGDTFCTSNTPECAAGDAFLIVFDTRFQGNASYPYASYLGGSGRESDVAMALAPNGQVHLVGVTQSNTTFPGMTFPATTAIFDLVIDPNQAPPDQLIRSGTIVEGLAANVLHSHESGAPFRLRPNGTYALLVSSDDPGFPLVEPLFDQPRDPNATSEMKARLLVYNPANDDIIFSSYLDDVTLAHRAHLASAPNGALYVATLTAETGRSASTTAIGQDDVLVFAIDGIGATVNHPPVANAGGDRTVPSSSPAGTRVLLYGGLSFDQDGDPLTYVWTEAGNPNPLGTGSLVEVLLTPGDHSITLTVDDGNGGTASETILVRVVPNTIAGGALTVTPEDSAWANFGIYNRYPITIQFTTVTGTGFTSVASRAPLPPVPPPGMQFGSPPHVYDVATTGAFTAPLAVCVDYRGMSFPSPYTDLRIHQQVNGTWVPLAQTNDTSARQICGTATTLGTFAVFTPAAAVNEISLLAGQPGRSSPCVAAQGAGVQGPDANEGGVPTDSSLCVTRGLAYDAARNYLYFSETSAGDKIRRVDLTTNRITTVAGTGFKTGTIDGPGHDPRDDDKNNVDPLTAPIHEALGLALDAAGNVLFAEFDLGGGRIRKVDFAQNRIFTVANVSAVSHPSTLAIDSSGAALFAGFADDTPHIWRLSPGADGVLNGSPDETLQMVAGTGATFFDPASLPGNPLQVGTPANGLAFGPDGSLYVAIGLGLPSVLRIAPGADGLVDGNGDTAFHVSGGGTLDPILGDGNPVGNSRLFSPSSVAVGPNGDVYVGDGGHFQAATVRRITAGADGVVTGAADEIISTVAGFHVFDPNVLHGLDLPYSDGDGHALSSIFSAAWGLQVLPNGDLLVNDWFQVRRIGPRVSSQVAMVNVSERIGVRDVAVIRPPALVGISERIAVSDRPEPRPSARVAISERIAVTDAARAVPPAVVSVTERLGVSDAPVLRAVDEIAPTLTLPSPIVVEAQTPNGSVVTFTVSATDNLPGPVQVSCSPASGSVFPFNGTGATSSSVACTATDAAGNVATGRFDVVVRDTTAPRVLTPQITVAATEATGARGNVPQAPQAHLLRQIPLLGAALDAGDPNPARVSVQWVACGNPAQVQGPIADATLYPIGTNCFSWVFRDASGNVGTGIGTIEVSPPIGGHIDVPNVAVTATDLQNVPLPVDATFLGLDQPGLLTAVPPQFPPAPPAGMVFVGAPLELRSTALAQAPVVVCMRPPSGAVAERLLALESGQWVDRTQASTAAGQICSRPGELGTFALVRRDMSGVTLSVSPLTGTRLVGFDHRVELAASDSSDPTTRLVISSRFEGSVELRHPQLPSSPLSVTIEDDAHGRPSVVTVSLGTGPGGELTSTVQQVADAINTQTWPQLIASAWPDWFGTGIVAPRPRMRFVPIRVTTAPDSGTVDCYITIPGACVAYVPSATTPYTAAITAYLDLNANHVADAGELTATAEVTWVDTTPPRVWVPANITVPAASVSGAIVTFTVEAFDNVDAEIPTACSPASGATFPIGTTTVTCTATDSSGNVGSGSFTVTVNPPPGETPDLVLPGNLTVAATSLSGAVVTYTAYAWLSAFGGSFQIGAFCTPPSGSTFPVGVTTVTCTATNPVFPPPLSFRATGSFTVTVLPFVPRITSLAPASTAAGGAAMVITVTGDGFQSGATAYWNGTARATVVSSATQLLVSIPAADLATTADLTTAQINVSNPGSARSNPLPFLITGPEVVSVDAEVALGGAHAAASTAPTQPGEHGVTATLINDDPASPPVTVAVASYGMNPVGDALFAAGGFFDVQVTGADPTDSLSAEFYYPSTIAGLPEARLRLLYWSGAAWLPVIGSGGAVPLKNTTDNLDGTISGGRFTVTLDGGSIPRITDLDGTVFALIEEEDKVAPATIVHQTPAANAHGWNNTDVTLTLTATDGGSGVARTEFMVNGGAWQIYAAPIVFDREGIYLVRFRSVDVAGNVESAQATRVRIDKTDPVFVAVAIPTLLPANNKMVDVTVLTISLDPLSGSNGITLVSVTSDDPGVTSDDIAGWTIGTNDTRGQLRAESAADGRTRTYTLTYRSVDKAGNASLAAATVLVPGGRNR